MEASEMDGRYLFTAVWCGPCKAIKARLPKDTDIKIVDIDEEPQLVKVLGIRAVPQLLNFEEGVVVQQIKGELNIMAEL